MRFEEQEDCYIDTKTGIKWSKENFGPISWVKAIQSPHNWKLPTINELISIIDPTHNPVTLLPGMLSSYYWSSSTCDDSAYVLNVHFLNGSTNRDYRTVAYYIRYIKEV